MTLTTTKYPSPEKPRGAAEASNALTLMLVGDTNLQNRSDPAEAFKYVLPVLREADVLFGQLEGLLAPPSTDLLAPDIPHKIGWCHSDPGMVGGLVAAGFAGVSCASNVAYGTQAILTGLATLEEAGIAHCGIGRNLEEAHRPAIIERLGVRFGFLSYTSIFWPVGHAAGPDTPGVATVKVHTAYQPDRRSLEMPGALPIVITIPDAQARKVMEEDVRRLREQVDILVVSCHWGVSSSEQVADYQRTLGHAVIDAGADVVMGHHPHKVQGIEVYRGKPIFHSLGNFAFDWEKMRHRNLEGLLVQLTIRDKRLAQLSLMPVRRNAENLITVLRPTEPEWREIALRVRDLSAALGAEVSIDGSEVVVRDIEAARS